MQRAWTKCGQNDAVTLWDVTDLFRIAIFISQGSRSTRQFWDWDPLGNLRKPSIADSILD